MSDDGQYIEVKLSREAAATVAGLIAPTVSVMDIVGGDGMPYDQVEASVHVWIELRNAFPLDLFREHGDWVGKGEKTNGN